VFDVKDLCRLKTWERATMGEERLCDELTKRDTGKLEHCSLNNNSYLQIIPTVATTHEAPALFQFRLQGYFGYENDRSHVIKVVVSVVKITIQLTWYSWL
jgi:hypothetical protein